MNKVQVKSQTCTIFIPNVIGKHLFTHQSYDSRIELMEDNVKRAEIKLLLHHNFFFPAETLDSLKCNFFVSFLFD